MVFDDDEVLLQEDFIWKKEFSPKAQPGHRRVRAPSTSVGWTHLSVQGWLEGK